MNQLDELMYLRAYKIGAQQEIKALMEAKGKLAIENAELKKKIEELELESLEEVED
jgi:hypothetical protein